MTLGCSPPSWTYTLSKKSPDFVRKQSSHATLKIFRRCAGNRGRACRSKPSRRYSAVSRSSHHAGGGCMCRSQCVCELDHFPFTTDHATVASCPSRAARHGATTPWHDTIRSVARQCTHSMAPVARLTLSATVPSPTLRCTVAHPAGPRGTVPARLTRSLELLCQSCSCSESTSTSSCGTEPT